MPPKGSTKNPRYLGTDERGYGMFKADCGHVVYGRFAKLCKTCWDKQRASPDYIGIIDRRQWYTAQCGHPASRRNTRLCAECRRSDLKRRGGAQDGQGYPVTRIDGHHIRVHTVIAEQTLGRKLKANEVVHHINMDRTDNRRCNLLICTREYHQYLHHAMELKTAARIRAFQDAQGV